MSVGHCAQVFANDSQIWALWIPGDFVIYAGEALVTTCFVAGTTILTRSLISRPSRLRVCVAVPMWLRLPANHFLSFIWTCYLSFLRGEATDDGEEEPVAETAQITDGK